MLTKRLLLGVAVSLLLGGCVTTGDKPDLQTPVTAGGITFKPDTSVRCEANAVCYASQNYSFSVFANSTDKPEKKTGLHNLGNAFEYVLNYSEEYVKKTGQWSNAYGNLESENGYKTSLNYVSEKPDEFLFMVAVNCTPDGIEPCTFEKLSNIFSELEPQLLNSIKTKDS